MLLEILSVSLTMIVRDEESNLPYCLSFIDGLFDECATSPSQPRIVVTGPRPGGSAG